MNKSNSLKSFAAYYTKWISLSALVGVVCGITSALFLTVLEMVTTMRTDHAWLLYVLPLGGLLVGWLYHAFGREVEGGNNLIIDEFHDPKAVIPFRMAPLVLIGTILTHLFGGSAGREGTAVQMGGSIADQLTRFLKTNRNERRALLMAGMSGGFGSVFGVPFAGMVFGMEVLAIGRLHLWAIVECSVAAFVAHFVTLALGIHHTEYVHPAALDLHLKSVAMAAAVGIIFGLAARLFGLVSHLISNISKSRIPYLPLRACIGGILISSLYFCIPLLTRYAGLGVPIVVDAFKSRLLPYDWLGKLALTALTLGVGFKGGEVTPLLFVGATLGNALSSFIPLPLPLLAGMGFVAVFAGAANTPLACTVMAMELFGPGMGVYAALACIASYAVSGHKGIYHTQAIHRSKHAHVSRTAELLKYLFSRPPLIENSEDTPNDRR